MSIGHGATLTGSTTGSIGKLTNIDWSGLVADDIDTTDFDSPDNVRVYEGGLLDAGEISADLRYDSTLFNTILDAVLARAVEYWTLTKDSNSLVIPGYLKSIGLAVPDGDNMMAPIVIKCTGKPQYQSSSSSSSAGG